MGLDQVTHRKCNISDPSNHLLCAKWGYCTVVSPLGRNCAWVFPHLKMSQAIALGEELQWSSQSQSKRVGTDLGYLSDRKKLLVNYKSNSYLIFLPELDLFYLEFGRVLPHFSPLNCHSQ